MSRPTVTGVILSGLILAGLPFLAIAQHWHVPVGLRVKILLLNVSCCDRNIDQLTQLCIDTDLFCDRVELVCKVFAERLAGFVAASCDTTSASCDTLVGTHQVNATLFDLHRKAVFADRDAVVAWLEIPTFQSIGCDRIWIGTLDITLHTNRQSLQADANEFHPIVGFD